MKVISIVNLKGGVGKTVTAVNMAAILATEHNKRVLVIDADPQANATRFFGAQDAPSTLCDLFSGCAILTIYICIPSRKIRIPAGLGIDAFRRAVLDAVTGTASINRKECTHDTLLNIK